MGHDYYKEDLSRFPESATATDLLFEHEWLRPMYASKRMHYGPEGFLAILRPLGERVAAWTAAGYSFNRSFDVWYRRLLSELRKPTIRIVDVMAIPEFNCKLARVPLDATSSLERIGGIRTQRLLVLDEQDPVDNISLHLARGWALVSKYSVAKVDAVSWWKPFPDDTYYRHRALLTALRLLHPGKYSEGLRLVAHASRFPFEQVMIYNDHPLIVPNQDEPSLPAGRAQQLRRLFKHLLRVSPTIDWNHKDVLPRPLSDAIFHFNEAGAESGWTQISMHLTMALEYLMGTRMEAQYRLSARVALLIGLDDEDTKRIYRQTQALYDARSTHAHGSEMPRDKWKEFYKGIFGEKPPSTSDGGITKELELINAAVEEGRNLVRRTLLACLRLQSGSANDLTLPFPSNFEETLFTSAREKLKRRAGVYKAIAF